MTERRTKSEMEIKLKTKKQKKKNLSSGRCATKTHESRKTRAEDLNPDDGFLHVTPSFTKHTSGFCFWANVDIPYLLLKRRVYENTQVKEKREREAKRPGLKKTDSSLNSSYLYESGPHSQGLIKLFTVVNLAIVSASSGT